MSSAESAMYRIERKASPPVHAECRIKRKASQTVHAECRIERKTPVHAECRTQCGVSRHRTGPSIRSLARSLGTGPSIPRLRRHSGSTDGGEAPAQPERSFRVYRPVGPAGRPTNSPSALVDRTTDV